VAKIAFITGITGQDGSYLAEFLLEKGYEVHGLVRKSSQFNTSRLDHIYNFSQGESGSLHLHYGDLQDFGSMLDLLQKIRPDEIYNLGAQSHVRVSFDLPHLTNSVVGNGTLMILECIRILRLETRFYQASSSEMFGNAPVPQNELTPLSPASPYAASKIFAHHIVQLYREAYGVYAVSGILFNHESPRRHETFVTRKISKSVAEIHLGLRSNLKLGNLTALRDWGYAPEYVKGMWMMLQRSTPEDFVLATGVSFSVEEFLSFCFESVGLNWRKYVIQDQAYFRPLEVNHLLGDATKARTILGWEPRVFGRELAEIMTQSDLHIISSGN
jgi:GDPmannose 4,6-dehydratase